MKTIIRDRESGKARELIAFAVKNDATIIAEKDDKIATNSADFSIASSTMIPVKENILKKVPNALTLV